MTEEPLTEERYKHLHSCADAQIGCAEFAYAKLVAVGASKEEIGRARDAIIDAVSAKSGLEIDWACVLAGRGRRAWLAAWAKMNAPGGMMEASPASEDFNS